MAFQMVTKEHQSLSRLLFLIINGLDVFANKFIIEMENIAVAVADNIIDKSLLERIISSINK